MALDEEEMEEREIIKERIIERIKQKREEKKRKEQKKSNPQDVKKVVSSIKADDIPPAKKKISGGDLTKRIAAFLKRMKKE